LLLFVVFLAVWAGIASFAFKNGDPKRLLLPVDTYGHRCGETDLADRQDLFFFDLTACLHPEAFWSGCKTPQVCVSSCPQDLWVADVYFPGNAPFNLTDVQTHLLCVNQDVARGVTNSQALKDAIDKGACARWYVPSMSFYYRCIPNMNLNLTLLVDEYKDKYNFIQMPFTVDVLNKSAQALKTLDEFNQVAQDVVNDLSATWRYLVMFSVAALVVSLLYIVLLRFLAGVVVWLSILALISLFATGAFFSYKNFEFLKEHPTGRIVPDNNNLEGKVTQLFNKAEFWLFLLVVCAILLFLIVLIIVFLRSRIHIATALIKEGSKAVSSTVTTLFFPIIPWALQLAVLLWSVGIFLFLYSTGTNAYRIEGMDGNCTCTGIYQGIGNNATCTVEEFNMYCHQTGGDHFCYTAGCTIYALNSTNLVLYLNLYNLFGFFWGVWFVSGLAQMILAGVFATWYWTFHKRHVPFFTLTRAIVRTMWYHMGTVAFGSLLIAICSFIRAMIEYVERKLKRFDNPISKAMICCCKCFFWCLQKFLCFINRNAYIMCAIHGKNFCVSAKDAFQLLMRNLIRVVFVDKVTDFLFFLGKLLVTAVLVVASYWVFARPVRLLDDSGRDVVLVYPWVPMAIVGVMTYIIASIFFSVYSVAVDTLFLCFLEDCERNDGSVEKPYFMSKQLMKILGKKNKKI